MQAGTKINYVTVHGNIVKGIVIAATRTNVTFRVTGHTKNSYPYRNGDLVNVPATTAYLSERS